MPTAKWLWFLSGNHKPYAFAVFAGTMTDNTQTDEPKGWALLWQFIRDKPVVDVLVTSGYFFLHPLRFTDEAVREDWSNKAKPPRFLIETYLIAVVLFLLTPWRVLDEPDLTLTDLQKGFTVGAELVAFACAFFAASFVAHLILGRDRLPFIRGFYLFCYIQGANLIAAHISVAFLWLAHGESPNRSMLLLTGIFELLLGLACIAYTIIPVVRAYRPRWYRLILAAFAGFVVLGAITIGLGYATDAIVARFPKSEHRVSRTRRTANHALQRNCSGRRSLLKAISRLVPPEHSLSLGSLDASTVGVL